MQQLKRTITRSSPSKGPAVQDLARELQSATFALPGLSLQSVSLSKSYSTSVLQSPVCNTTVITVALYNPYGLISYHLQWTLTVVQLINHLFGKSE